MSARVAAVAEPSSRSTGPITFAWSWRGTPIPVEYEMSGPAAAEPILMLPALSTVSTRDELRALAHHLETRRCVITDWPGFGDTARPRLDYDRALCRGFLEELVAQLQGGLGRRSFPVVACGHAAGYAIDLEARQPGTFTHLVLIAPTWRGPLPTMMSGRRPIQGRIRRLIHAPVIGELLYRLNVSRPVVRMMYRRHVFADPAFLTEELLAQSHASNPPVRRPLRVGLFRHRRPRPVRRSGRLPYGCQTRSAPHTDALRPRYAAQVPCRDGSTRGPAGDRKQAPGTGHARDGRGACRRIGTADRRFSLEDEFRASHNKPT